MTVATVVIEFELPEGKRSMAFAVTDETAASQIATIADLLPEEARRTARWRVAPNVEDVRNA